MFKFINSIIHTEEYLGTRMVLFTFFRIFFYLGIIAYLNENSVPEGLWTLSLGLLILILEFCTPLVIIIEKKDSILIDNKSKYYPTEKD